MDDTLFNMLDFAGSIAGEKQTEKQYSFFFRMPSLLNIHGKTKNKENNQLHPCLINIASFSGSGANMC